MLGVSMRNVLYTCAVPKLWTETIDAHRREVHEAIQDRTAELVATHGLRAVTMSQVADAVGIGRATLYKYYSDIEAILLAWHQRQVEAHFEELAALRDEASDPMSALEAVLEAYAFISQQHQGSELAALVHRGAHMASAEHRLGKLVRDIVAKAAHAGAIRGDVSPEELAQFCLHALTAASQLSSKAAVRRLVAVTLAGLKAG
jgi:AcrR family transcriptional regulator